MAKNWTKEEVDYLKEHLRLMTPEQVAKALGKSEMAVRLFCYRHQISLREPLKRPMIVELLRVKFGNPEYFKPTREFYEKVEISQKRFSLLRMGYAQPTERELERVCRELNMQHEEYVRLMAARQLSLFDL